MAKAIDDRDPMPKIGSGYSLMKRWLNRPFRMAIGAGLVGVSAIALAAPFAVGTWSLQFLGLPMFIVGAVDLYTTFSNSELRSRPSSYAMGFLAIAGALLLYLSPALVTTSVVALLLALLAIDGAIKLSQAVVGRDGTSPTVAAINGVSNLLIALIGWWLWKKVSLESAIGVAVAGYTLAAGWRMLVAPVPEPYELTTSENYRIHPYAKLGLPEHELIGAANASHAQSADAVRQTEFYWLAVAALVLFAIHLGRMRSGDTWLGLISPFVATAGDFIMALVLGGLLILPLRLAWRRLTAPLENKAWQLHFSGEDERMGTLPRLLVQKWIDARLSFSRSLRDARASLPSAGAVVIRLGLPLAVLFVALNPIWGFTWYFNTESWTSAFYQKMTELRVDPWRADMVDRIRSVYPGKGDDLFQVKPQGIAEGDFSFIVIGDTGEGDGSQYSLVERYLDIGRRDAVKFLVISSDVIYPAGAMEDYESNFYLPFNGFKKPIYAIPGNHDWFDALEGFNANFLEPDAARAALIARVESDLHLTSTNRNRIDRLLDQAQRLRQLYGIQIAGQRGPFFEIQTSDFALIAIDTGIRRTIDEKQREWLDGAINRARGKFTMAIVGHPKYAGGQDTSIGDAAFAELYAMLERSGINVMMAGDTHAFEYYVDYVGAGPIPHPAYHFVNGGGGAYLSIGGALGWPDTPPTETWAFYPGPEAVRAKLDAETPLWKQPFWWWIKRFSSWPLSTETLSGMFDFNQAPFFQSFMEIRVERSSKRVVFALHGTGGPVRWRDLSSSFKGVIGAGADDPVEFIVSMRP